MQDDDIKATRLRLQGNIVVVENDKVGHDHILESELSYPQLRSRKHYFPIDR